MGLRKGYKYSDEQKTTCELCGHVSDSPQGDRLHKIHKHGFDPSVAREAVETNQGGDNRTGRIRAIPATKSHSDVQAMKARVELAELEDRLEAIEIKRANRARVPDVSERAGLGSLQPSIASEIQARAFNPGQRPSLTEMAQEISALRGILGLDGKSQGGDGVPSWLSWIGSLLGMLGVSKDEIRGIVKKFVSPGHVAGADFEFEGFRIPMGTFTNDAFNRIMEHKTKVAVAEADKASRERMADSFDSLREALTPMIIAKFGGGGLGAPGAGVSERAMPERMVTLTCEGCGETSEVPASELYPGRKLVCDKCECEIEIYDKTATEKPQKARRQKQPKLQEPEPETVTCIHCQGVCQVPEGLPSGQLLECQHCHKEFELADSPKVAKLATRVEKQPESLLERNRRLT